MAGPLSKSSLFSILRSHSQKPEPAVHLPRRRYHVELGAREKALLEEDPALKKFKSYKNTVKRVSKIGDALTVLVVAGDLGAVWRSVGGVICSCSCICSYEIYAAAVTRKEQRQH